MFRRLWPFFKKHKDDYFTVFATSTSSNKVAHIKANPKFSVYYCDSENGRGLTLIGDAVIEEGMALKEEIWDPAWTLYYPRGISDPDFTVVSLKPTMARNYYNLECCDFKI
jgi:general stress protein 26